MDFKTLYNEILTEGKTELEKIKEEIAKISVKYGEKAATALENLLEVVQAHSTALKSFQKKTPKPTLSKKIDINNPKNNKEREKISEYKTALVAYKAGYEDLQHTKLNALVPILDSVKAINVPEKDPCGLEYTQGNSKVGDDTIIINMGPATVCDSAKAGKCDLYFLGFCYAQNNESTHKLAIVKRFREKLQWKFGNPTTIATQISDVILKLRKRGDKIKYVRFNESGDFATPNDATPNDVSKFEQVVEETNKLLGSDPVIFYTYTHRSDLFETYKPKSKELIIQGSGKFGETGKEKPFFVHNCFMGIDYGIVVNLLENGKLNDSDELKTALGLPLDKPIKNVVYCPGNCFGCLLCKTKKEGVDNGRLILVMNHGMGAELTNAVKDVTKQLRDLFKQNANQILKLNASNIPDALKKAIFSTQYFHENSVVEKLLLYTMPRYNNKTKVTKPPLVDIDSIYPFIMDMRESFKKEVKANPKSQILKATRRFLDLQTGKASDEALLQFIDKTRQKIKRGEVITDVPETSGPTDVPTVAVNSSYKLNGNLLTEGKKFDISKVSSVNLANMALDGSLAKFNGFKTENDLYPDGNPDKEVEETPQPAPVQAPTATAMPTTPATPAPTAPTAPTTGEVVADSLRVQKNMRKILGEKKCIILKNRL